MNAAAQVRPTPVGEDRSPHVDVLLPDSWWVVDVRSPDRRERSVAALVDRQVGRGDRRATLRADLRSEVGRIAQDAADAGAFLLAFSLMQWQDVPLPASVTAYRVPRVRELTDLQAELAEQDDDVDLVVEERGTLLRRVWRRAGPDSLGARFVTMLRADYWLDLPSATDLLLFSFSTPMTAAADVMVELFDVIVSTVDVHAETRSDEPPESSRDSPTEPATEPATERLPDSTTEKE